MDVYPTNYLQGCDTSTFQFKSITKNQAAEGRGSFSHCPIFVTSCQELKIRWEVLDWSAYHTAAAAAPRLRLNISVSIDLRLSISKIWNLWKKKKFFYLMLYFKVTFSSSKVTEKL